MSLVIAVKDKDKIVLGSDTQVTCEKDHKGDFDRAAATKCNIIEKFGIAIVSVGSATNANFFNFDSEIFSDFSPEEGLTKKYLVTKVVPRYKKILIDNDCLKNKNDNKCEFVVAYKDKMYVIDNDFSVYRTESYHSAGVGKCTFEYFYNKPDLSVRDKILSALRYVGENYVYVGAPYKITDTKSLKMEVVEK